jgi:hypothetical protein
VARVFFATNQESEWVVEIEEMLDVFGNTQMNKYLVYGIIELVVLRLVPEMGEKVWSELLAERGVIVPGEISTDADELVEDSQVEDSQGPRPRKTTLKAENEQRRRQESTVAFEVKS